MIKKCVLFVALSAGALGAQACADPMAVFIGQVCTFTQSWCPRGFLRADGARLNIANYTALFSILGHTYSDRPDANNFNLPDLRGRVVLGAGQGPQLSPVGLGERGGAEAVVLLSDQLPSHSHPVELGQLRISASKKTGGLNEPVDGAYLAAGGSGGSAAPIYTDKAPAKTDTVQLTGITGVTAPVGQAAPVPTRTPYLGLTQCIAYEGVYPARPD